MPDWGVFYIYNKDFFSASKPISIIEPLIENPSLQIPITISIKSPKEVKCRFGLA